MYLRDIDVWADDEIVDRYPGGFVLTFSRATTGLSGFYDTRLARKLANPNTMKLLIKMTDTLTSPPSWEPSRFFAASHVAEFKWPFDFANYVASEEPQQRRMIGEAIYAATRWFGELHGWNLAPLDAVHEEAICNDFKVEGFWKRKSWLSPNRKLRAKVYFKVGLKSVELELVVFDRANREIGRKPLAKDWPGKYIVEVLIDKGAWTSDSVFELRAKSASPKYHWSCDVSDLLVAGARPND